MAKKRMNPFGDDAARAELEKMGVDSDMAAGLLPNMLDLAPLLDTMSSEDGQVLFTMMASLAEEGVTPEKYASFYEAFGKLRPIFMQGLGNDRKRITSKSKISEPKKAVKDKTLLLRIQMKGVTKPPMWREVEVPSGMTFLDLHDVIQTVAGLDDYHLWQFNRHAYDPSLQIGVEAHEGNFGNGLDFVTNDADSTLISEFLAKTGDKLEYVYDFGDDWIFSVSVKDVLDKKSDHPVCTAYKSDLNPIEDTGGPWNYERMRQDFMDWKDYTAKKKKEIAEEAGFDSAKSFHDMLKENIFDLSEVNDFLKEF